MTEQLLAREALAALQALPPPFAEVLALRFGQSLTVPEIAAALAAAAPRLAGRLAGLTAGEGL